ncbi:response regulator transcription factor, partial [Alkalimonas sp.]|uniref:response regulator transcription factor n=1 Tax=Alkalimonas sp. TaxID=1872453 RepID=UPI00263B8D41
MRILVTEDHPDLQLELVDYLQAHGYLADAAETLASMNEKLQQCQYQVVLLDLTLPDGDGLQQLSGLRAQHGLTLGIVVVSARGQPQQRALAMQQGADAYLVKPVYLPELLALLQQLQQRLKVSSTKVSSTNTWRLDDNRRQLICPTGQPIPLSHSELQVLIALHQGTQSKAELFQALAPYLSADASYGRLDTLICRLRQKVQQTSGQALPLHTIRNQGYQLLDTELSL